jgi:hypothetical protein
MAMTGSVTERMIALAVRDGADPFLWLNPSLGMARVLLVARRFVSNRVFVTAIPVFCARLVFGEARRYGQQEI